MPNHRKAIFMVSPMPNKPMKAGRNAVSGMERMGAAIGLIRLKNQRKLAMSRPSGMAMATHHENAWAMRHQLVATFFSRLLSDHSDGKARMTSSGVGTEKRFTISQWVTMVQTITTTTQLRKARAHLVAGETSLRIVRSSRTVTGLYDGLANTLISVRRFFSRPSGLALLSSGLSGPLPAVRRRAPGNLYFSIRYCLTASARCRESCML